MLSLVIFGVILSGSLYLGVLVYRHNPNGRDNRLFILLIFWMIIWLIANYLENEPLSDTIRSTFLYIDFIVAPILGYFWFCFAFGFLEEEKYLSRSHNLALLLSVAVIITLIVSGMVITKVDAGGRIIQFELGLLFSLYAIAIIFYFIGGSIVLYFKYRRLIGRMKLQTLHVLYGFLLTSLIGATVNLFFQEYLPIELFRFSTYSILIFISFTAFAIIKHHLFDLRSIIQRGIIYSGLLAVIVGFYLVSLSIIEFIFKRSDEIVSLVTTIIIIIAGIFGVPSLERLFRRVTDKIFFKDKYNYSEAMYQLSEILNKHIILEELLKQVSSALKKIYKVNHIKIYLVRKNIIYDENNHAQIPDDSNIPDFLSAVERFSVPTLAYIDIPDMIKQAESQGKKEFVELLKKSDALGKKYGVAAAATVMHEERLIGLIALGKKISGDQYSEDDMKLLKTFANQAAVALERAQLLEQVKDYSRELEKKVLERTTKIKALQEEQGQIMLEIAHGLQTPLTIIKGELGSLTMQVDDSSKIKTLEKSIDRVSGFIYDMLHLSDLESGISNLKKEKFSFSDFLNELMESYKIITQERKINIIGDIESGIEYYGDRRKLEDVVNNLVSNSVKYTKEKGEKNIYLSLKRVNQTAIEVKVVDNGIGIDNKHLPGLFQRFHRINDGPHAKKQGTGLGLAICKEIVGRHNGKISIKSRPGQGTTITVSLPIIPA